MPKSPSHNWFSDALAQRPPELLRKQPPAFHGCDFTSNDYLGLGELPLPVNAPLASKGSRLLAGSHSTLLELEATLAAFHGSETCLVFPSAYQANLALVQSIVESGGQLVFDKHIHASIVDGARLSGAGFARFRHNQAAELDKQLGLLGSSSPAFVFTESVFSIRGDQAPLKALLEVCQQHKAQLIVDEAHACGWMPDGKALADQLGLDKDVSARVLAFGKGWGAQGGALLCTEAHKQWMLNSARALVYSTAVSPAWCQLLLQRLKQVQAAQDARGALQARLSKWSDVTGNVASTPIQFVHTASNEAALQLSDQLLESGMRALPIRVPTAPGGQAGLRVNIRANHTWEELEALLQWIDRYDVAPISGD